MAERRGRLATDVGGTFTDLVSLDDASGELRVAKVLTTPADPSEGVMAAIAASGIDPTSLGYFIHGGTTVINAITERKGAKTALVTTAGFRDVLEIGRGNRPDLYNLRFRSPQPFVPRSRVFEVRERVDAEGEIIEPLCQSDLATIAKACRAAEVAAIAICFINSYRAPHHEEEAARYFREALPGVAVTASHEVTREWREYERSNTAVLNAYVQPVMEVYLDRLAEKSAAAGIACPLHVMQSNVGSARFTLARRHPITLVESGPAGGTSGTAYIGRILSVPNIIYFDLGGTTAKCSLIRSGEPKLDSEYRLGRTRLDPGYPIKVPVVDIVEVGAGGGSIAYLDDVGRLRVGPQSAGADPGPACYGRGGQDPTVSDAKLITGGLDGERFSGGLFKLDRSRAEAAVRPIADTLRCGIEEAAFAIIRIAEANMINALKLISVQRGHDTRDFALLACGGGGPMHAGALARELGVREMIVPQHAGIFSAWGMLATPPRQDLARTALVRLGDVNADDIGAVFADMSREAVAYFEEDSRAEGRLRSRAQLSLRYHGQEHSVLTPIDLSTIDINYILDAFHVAHEQAFTYRLPGAEVELVTYHLTAELDAPLPPLPRLPPERGSLAESFRGKRHAWFDESGPQEAAIHERDLLPAGALIDGPAIIEEATTTTLLLPGQRLRCDEYGLLRISEAG